MNFKFISVFFLFLTACQSVSPGSEAYEQKQNSSLYKKSIEQSCFSSKIGSFFAYVSSPETPSVSWEGKWNKNFSQLKTQLLDPTGAVITLNPLSEIIEKFGAHGLREVMCGKTAFSPTLKLDGHKIVVKSRIKTKLIDDTKTMIETTSEFYYGLFAKKTKNILYWQGIIQNAHVTPKLIRFGSGDEFLTIDFIDYE